MSIYVIVKIMDKKCVWPNRRTINKMSQNVTNKGEVSAAFYFFNAPRTLFICKIKIKLFNEYTK